MTIPHDQQANHNGGQLQFGPDGLLYAGTGDGGSGGDPSGNAQTTAPAPPSCGNGVNHDYRLGKLLRIDPATGAVSIFAYGLRNPWRFSYDRNTGDLVIGDVGQDRYEEVDFAAAPGDGAGANYGWNQYEGLHTYPGNAPAGAAPGTVLPVIEYPHSPACSITGGYVVRDVALPELAGTYLYGDNCTGAISGATLPAGTTRTLGLTVANVSSFGEDGCGRVYAASLGGAVYRFASSGACAGPAPFVGRLPAGAAAARARPPRARLHPAARRRAPARAAHRLRHHPRPLRRAVHRARARARAHHAQRARGGDAAAEHAHRQGDAGRGRAHDPAPEALEGDPPLDQAVAGAAGAAGHGPHHHARRGYCGQRAQHDAARADRPVVAAQLPPGPPRPIG